MGIKSVVTAIVFAAVLSACTTLPKTDVEADWTAAVARLNFIGVYPVTEDLAPGDVLLSIPAEAGSPRPMLQRLGAIDKMDIIKALLLQEKSRIGLAPMIKAAPTAATASGAAASPANTVTLSANSTATSTITTQVRVAPAAAAVSAKSKTTKSAAASDKLAAPDVLAVDAPQIDGKIKPRFRRVSVPSVIAASAQGGDIGAGGSTGSVSLGAAFGGRRQSAVQVSFRQLEALGLDTLPAIDLLDQHRLSWLRHHNLSAPRLLSLAGQASAELLTRLCRGMPHAPKRSVIDVVNRVLYAHQIQFEFDSDSAVAGKLAANFAQSAALAAGTVPILAAATPSAAAPGVASAQDALSAVNGQSNALASSLSLPVSPGVRTSFGIASSGKVALTDTFDQPMAVGYTPIASYSVRGSMIFTGETAAESDAEDALLLAICNGLPHPQAVPDTLQPIEKIVCENTAALLPADPSLILARKCLMPDTSFAIGKQQALHLRPEVRPDLSESLLPIPPLQTR